MGEKHTGHLLSIGVIAKCFGVNESTIRRVEAAGLLTPALVVNGSGYRYYDSDNVAVLAEIFALKSFGFLQEDIKEYLTHPGEYWSLYEKLLEKQTSINTLVERFGRRIKNLEAQKYNLTTYDDAYCICKTERIQLNAKVASSISKDFLFETIQKKIPINYQRPILILTECMDYRTFQIRQEQEYTFCIPLPGKIEHDGVRFFPSSYALWIAWDVPVQDYYSFVPTIKKHFELFDLKQSDTLRFSYEIGGYLGNHISDNEMFGHLLIPVSQPSD